MNKNSEDWELWQTENVLINHRLTWLGVVSPLMFGAFYLAGQGSRDMADTVSLFGFAVSAAIFISVLSAIAAQLILWRRPNNGIKNLGINGLTTVGGWVAPVFISGLVVWAWWGLWVDVNGISTGLFSKNVEFLTK